jgi:hypothetical protein
MSHLLAVSSSCDRGTVGLAQSFLNQIGTKNGWRMRFGGVPVRRGGVKWFVGKRQDIFSVVDISNADLGVRLYMAI